MSKNKLQHSAALTFQVGQTTVGTNFHLINKEVNKLNFINISTQIHLPESVRSLAYTSPILMDALEPWTAHYTLISPRVKRTSEIFRDRSGNLSANTLALGSFQRKFLYIVAAHFGSHNNAVVLHAAHEKGLSIPEGSIFLEALHTLCLKIS